MANKQIANGVWLVDDSETRLRDGAWVSDGSATYLVDNQSKLANIPDAHPGDIAFTAAYKKLWQMDTDGTSWVEFPSSSISASVAAAAASAAAAEAAIPAKTEVTGATPSITGAANTRYICGEISTLSFTPSATGICSVLFESGTTPTVLTLPTGANAITWPEWFDPTSLEANTTYELNVLDGKYGVVALWQ